MSYVPAAVAALVLLAVPMAAVAPPAGPPTFSTYLVDEAISTGEPGLWLDTRTATPSMWMVAPAEGVWRSTDGGVSWDKPVEGVLSDPNGVWTNGDASIAMDDDGVLYLSGMTDEGQLTSTVPVQVSLDGGSTWTRWKELLPNAAGIECDRQWTAARGHGESVTSIRCGSEGVMWRTTDGGITYSGPFTIATDVAQLGPIFYSPDGNLYSTYWDFEAVRLARSSDGGLTWTNFKVADLIDTRSFTVGAADSAGNLYVVWDQSSSFTGLDPAYKSRIFVASSQNDGQTWTPAKQVSDERTTAIFPWVVAGAPGKVDIAYYVEHFIPGDPLANFAPADLGGPVTTWDLVMAQSVNGLVNNPAYARVTVVETFHTGSICTSGLSCVGPQNLAQSGNVPTPFDRRFLDYFEMRLDSAGNAYIAYGQDRPMTNCLDSCFVGDLVFSWVDFRIARQVGGTTLA